MHASAVLYAQYPDTVASFYAAVIGFTTVTRDDEHIQLELPTFELVVLRMPDEIARNVTIESPPVRRTNAAIKLVLFVEDMAAVRAAVALHGGVMNGPSREWVYNDCTVCDDADPEGNVVQFRARRCR